MVRPAFEPVSGISRNENECARLNRSMVGFKVQVSYDRFTPRIRKAMYDMLFVTELASLSSA